MGAGLSVVDVEDAYGDDDAEANEDEGEEEVLAQQGKGQRGRGDDLGDEQEEHGLRQEDRDAEHHLLPRVGRQVEHQHRQVRDPHTRHNQVHCVKQRLPP